MKRQKLKYTISHDKSLLKPHFIAQYFLKVYNYHVILKNVLNRYLHFGQLLSKENKHYQQKS